MRLVWSYIYTGALRDCPLPVAFWPSRPPPAPAPPESGSLPRQADRVRWCERPDAWRDLVSDYWISH